MIRRENQNVIFVAKIKVKQTLKIVVAQKLIGSRAKLFIFTLSTCN